MNCPRCGERMYGSVCPRCGNVVVDSNRMSQPRTSSYNNRRLGNYSDNIQFMDNAKGPIRPSKKSGKKKHINGSLIFMIISLVLLIVCIVLFVKYNDASSKYTEASTQINTLNESIKAKDEEISKLKEQTTEATTKSEKTTDSSDSSDSSDTSVPDVEFDENGNLVSISEGSNSSDSSDSGDSSDESDSSTKYESGDTYTVKSGDTGSTICNKIYGKYSEELWEKLLSANGMTTSSNYHPGDELKIP